MDYEAIAESWFNLMEALQEEDYYEDELHTESNDLPE